MIEYLQENNLIICPRSLQKSVIEEINQQEKLISFKIMDLSQLKENYFFSYDQKAIYYLMNKLNIKYDIAVEYLESFYYLENKTYHSHKLNQLLALKQELENQKLLKKNPLFQYYLQHTTIIIYGYFSLDPFYVNLLQNQYHAKWIKTEETKITKVIYEFNDIEEEIAYVCEDIRRKLDEKVPIECIKIVQPSDEYLLPLKRIFTWCHLPINLENKISLAHLPIGNFLLKQIKNNIPFSKILEELSEKIDDLEIINQIINIFNQYVDWEIETTKLYECIHYDLEHTFQKQKQKENTIQIVTLEELNSDDYGYLLGFNKENYPTVYQDEEFLSDQMKVELSLFTSNEKNKNSILKLKQDLYHNPNLCITYKLKTAFESYNPSLLIKEEQMQVIKNPKLSFQISNLFNQITLAKEYDKFYQYGIHSETLEYLKKNYKLASYRTYQNQFTGLDEQEFLHSLNKPLTLSYSAINEYYHCAFRYYINHILKIKEENVDEFYMYVGNIFHYVLSKSFIPNFDFDRSWNEEAKKYNFTLSQQLLLEKLKIELQYDIDIIKKQTNYTHFNEFLFEKRFAISVPNHYHIPVEFVGVVDKINYLKEENRTLVSIIDYKTGTITTNLNNMIYGLGMQLPIYLYFVKRSNLFPNTEIVGFYLQKIINKEIKATNTKTIEELKENALKLVGYSIDDEELLEKFDMTYQESALIQGLKKKKEGFYAYSKVLNKNQFEKIDNLVENKIQDATNSILSGKFLINPKKIENDKIGCENCSYRDICYKNESDFIELKKHQNLDFLGGDSYAELDS